MKRLYGVSGLFVCIAALTAVDWAVGGTITWDLTNNMGGTYIPRYYDQTSPHTYKETVRDYGQPVGPVESFTLTFSGTIVLPTYLENGVLRKGSLLTQLSVCDREPAIPVYSLNFGYPLSQNSYNATSALSRINYVITGNAFTFSADGWLNLIASPHPELFLSNGNLSVKLFLMAKDANDNPISVNSLVEPSSINLERMTLTLNLIPEPATLSMFAAGCLLCRRRKIPGKGSDGLKVI